MTNPIYSEETFGNRWLCAWWVAPRTYWVQTRLPMFARMLRDRQNPKRVAYGVSGGYLQTYELKIGRRSIQKLITRWLSKLEGGPAAGQAAAVRRKPRHPSKSIPQQG